MYSRGNLNEIKLLLLLLLSRKITDRDRAFTQGHPTTIFGKISVRETI